MVDVHCHILPGLDDGPDNMELSLAMAESAIADGITHVVATPHSSNEYFFDYSRVRELLEELRAKIGDRLILASGCDFHLNPENLEALGEDAPPFFASTSEATCLSSSTNIRFRRPWIRRCTKFSSLA